MHIAILIAILLAIPLLIRVWTGVLHLGIIESLSLQDIERRHPYLPKAGGIIAVGLITAGLVLAALHSNGILSGFMQSDKAIIVRTLLVFAAVGALGVFDEFQWRGQKDRYHYFFGFVLSTIVTWILIAFKRAFFETGLSGDPYLMALGIVCVILGWRFLFGPWSASIKATVLATAIFWVSYAVLRHESREELIATGLAAILALVPVVIWCKLFLSQHRERLSVVFLAFFAGMLSTVPILFYDALLRHSVEFNFFFFKIVLQDFGGSSGAFVRQSLLLHTVGAAHSTLIAGVITYLLVGAIEEMSKYWVLRHSTGSFLRSIDDALALAIIVALGFAFAENLENPGYFIGFVRTYLLSAGGPQWGALLSNLIGRSVLTTMVHVLSTGVMGYFIGVAFFASPLLKDQFTRGKVHPVVQWVHRLLSIRSESIFRNFKTAQGIGAAIALHGLFDFLVSLPEILPGNPSTIGGLIGSAPGSVLSGVSIVLLPALLYVVGGFWLLLYLFNRTEDMKEFGAIIDTQAIITEEQAA